jgi:hypothetical protein
MALHTFEEKDQPIEYDFVNDERTIRSKTPGPILEQIEEIAGDEEISLVRNQLRTIQTKTKALQGETKFSFIKQEEHNEEV